MSQDPGKIEEALAKAFRELELSDSAVQDAVFHMTDWLKDSEEWYRFCSDPESLTSDELNELVVSFLVHVPAHLAAASKIVTGLPVTDVFCIGATSEEQPG